MDCILRIKKKSEYTPEIVAAPTRSIFLTYKLSKCTAEVVEVERPAAVKFFLIILGESVSLYSLENSYRDLCRPQASGISFCFIV